MDEESALKLIFRNNYDPDSGTVTFNARTYLYSDYEHEKKHACFYAYILQNSEALVATERTEEIDADTVEVKKITEEQFVAWQKQREKPKTRDSLTGREIWCKRKAEGRIEDDVIE